MPTSTPTPIGATIVLAPDEREVLLELLRQSLGETRLETPSSAGFDYRAEVERQERVMKGLLTKLESSGH